MDLCAPVVNCTEYARAHTRCESHGEVDAADLEWSQLAQRDTSQGNTDECKQTEPGLPVSPGPAASLGLKLSVGPFTRHG
jgi:hypothetical protein